LFADVESSTASGSGSAIFNIDAGAAEGGNLAGAIHGTLPNGGGILDGAGNGSGEIDFTNLSSIF
jgi:hypothetical protein